jgi:hypothetical protein
MLEQRAQSFVGHTDRPPDIGKLYGDADENDSEQNLKPKVHYAAPRMIATAIKLADSGWARSMPHTRLGAPSTAHLTQQQPSQTRHCTPPACGAAFFNGTGSRPSSL